MMKSFFLFISIAFATLLFTGCYDSYTYTADINGSWYGYAPEDNDTIIPYSLKVEQDKTVLYGELDINDTKIVDLSGTIFEDNFKLMGFNTKDNYLITGKKEDNQTIRIQITKNEDINNSLSLHLSNNSITDSKFLSGVWKNFYTYDMNGEEIENPPSFMLNVNENKGSVSGYLSIDDNGMQITVTVDGTIVNADINMSGNSTDGDHYIINGKLDTSTTLQLTIIKNFDLYNLDNTVFYNALFNKTIMHLGPTTNEIFLRKECGSSTDKTIVLIHGFNSNADIWGSLVGTFNSKGICKKYSVWTFQYDWKKSISDSANDMKIYIENNLGNNSPIIIAHSMGGLVARKYIANYGKFTKLITLGTPHQGIDQPIAELGLSIFKDYIDAPSVKDMMIGSKFLLDLSTNRYEKSQRSKYLLLNGNVAFNWYCTRSINVFGAERCTMGHFSWTGDYSAEIQAGYFLLPRPNDGVVTADSARFSSYPYVQRAGINQFNWVSHRQLPYAQVVENYIVDQLQ